MTFASVSVGLGDDSYVQLLQDYRYDRLGLKQDVAADEALVAQIIATAEGRFVYVSILTDRFIALARERVVPELVAATEGGSSGEARLLLV